MEGGGLRSWGLATGLRANDPELEILLAYNDAYRPQSGFGDSWDSIDITTWTLETLPELVRAADTVVVSFCMDGISTTVVNSIRTDAQLVLDCYVPIYVEVSARDSHDLDREMTAYAADIQRWNASLHRGDLFLCASQQQVDYYRGVLSAVGRLNPATYGQELMMVVPFGIHREQPQARNQPVSAMVGDDSAKKVLWFGGIYPWFEFEGLVDAAHSVDQAMGCKLIVVGARNPFNEHPDFVRKFEDSHAYASRPEHAGLVFFHDWVRYDERADWYLDSDVVVMVSRPGEENRLAWRTRLMDYMWAGLPILTNGGDPLSELLLEHGAAFRLEGLEAPAIAEGITRVVEDDQARERVVGNARQLKNRFYWDAVTGELSAAIKRHQRARDLMLYPADRGGSVRVEGGGTMPLLQIRTNARAFYAHARQYGLRSAVHASAAAMRHWLPGRQRLSASRRWQTTSGRLVVISHRLDMSGAPKVVMDVTNDVHQSMPMLPIVFYTYLPTHPDNLEHLKQAGLDVRVLPEPNMVPHLRDADVVLLNTVAHSAALKDSLLARVEQKRLDKLLWYAHEDEPERFFTPDETRRMRDLLDRDCLQMFLPSLRTLDVYRAFFDRERAIDLLPYRVTVPESMQGARSAADFDRSLRFVLPGPFYDGRKGQLPVFYALCAFFEEFFQRDQGRYREFELTFIGLERDFLSRQVLRHAGALEGRLRHFPQLPHADVLNIIREANMTICYSLNEALPIFPFESMLSGHPLLRNDCAGLKEQLEPGGNGWLLDSCDPGQLVTTFETVLNRSKTSTDELVRMSERSVEIASAQQTSDYMWAFRDTLLPLSGRRSSSRARPGP
ncbi:MAG: glycosyltransferase [Candidatus Dormibacteraeota bacterium]|uniref:Glycosyltransferase n=1 Tax=Candidatus Amunia macphersoniae TaxID=3127014 RepID=A0A934KN87_9BACT|nr:glycosyltransferase [Candidatus Dormibacteraeota bacterium]